MNAHINQLYIYILVVFRRYAPDSSILYLNEITIYFMVLVKKICSKYKDEYMLKEFFQKNIYIYIC